jgi:hypothetical protein
LMHTSYQRTATQRVCTVSTTTSVIFHSYFEIEWRECQIADFERDAIDRRVLLQTLTPLCDRAALVAGMQNGNARPLDFSLTRHHAPGTPQTGGTRRSVGAGPCEYSRAWTAVAMVRTPTTGTNRCATACKTGVAASHTLTRATLAGRGCVADDVQEPHHTSTLPPTAGSILINWPRASRLASTLHSCRGKPQNRRSRRPP